MGMGQVANNGAVDQCHQRYGNVRENHRRSQRPDPTMGWAVAPVGDQVGHAGSLGSGHCSDPCRICSDPLPGSVHDPAKQPQPQHQPDDPHDDRGVHERADRRPQQHQPEDQGDDADDRGVHAQRLGQAFDKMAAGATHQLEQTAEGVNDETDGCAQDLAKPLKETFYLHGMNVLSSVGAGLPANFYRRRRNTPSTDYGAKTVTAARHLPSPVIPLKLYAFRRAR
ncbi:hypothetical protein EMIT0P218_40010 [Pseudomonas sp. IT-P218]